MSKGSQELSRRDRHLFESGPKRILSLDGGGIRGAITIAFLERLEVVIEEIEGKPTLLADWFDIIGGTSTGAIIASALALGYRAAEIHEFYKQFGPRVFQNSFWRVVGLRAKFNANNLKSELDKIVGDRTLDSDDLVTGVCVVTKRLDTGSVWMLMNNPRLPHWNTPQDETFIGNRHYRLASVIRASAAAPYYFDPEYIEIAKGMPPGLFVDGAVTPHNNPVLHILLATTLPQYGLGWPFGADRLTIVSIGTGTWRPKLQLSNLSRFKTLGIAAHALTSQISGAEQLVLMLMSWLGHSPTPWEIDSVIKDLGQMEAPGGNPLFRFLRYNVVLETEWLARELKQHPGSQAVERYRLLDESRNISAIYQLGALAAELQIKREHLVR
jgi:patatin-like phospholipase